LRPRFPFGFSSSLMSLLSPLSPPFFLPLTLFLSLPFPPLLLRFLPLGLLSRFSSLALSLSFSLLASLSLSFFFLSASSLKF